MEPQEDHAPLPGHRNRRTRRSLSRTKRIVPTPENLEHERHHLAWMKQDIAEGRFRFAEEFPEYAARHSARIPISVQTCSDVFDAFLRHEEARVARGELTQTTIDGHRQILNRWWRSNVGDVLFKEVKASTLDKIADRQGWSKKTYNNAIGAIKGAFQFGARDYPERQNPAAALKYAKVAKRRIDLSASRTRSTSSPRYMSTGAKRKATSTSCASSRVCDRARRLHRSCVTMIGQTVF